MNKGNSFNWIWECLIRKVLISLTDHLLGILIRNSEKLKRHSNDVKYISILFWVRNWPCFHLFFVWLHFDNVTILYGLKSFYMCGGESWNSVYSRLSEWQGNDLGRTKKIWSLSLLPFCSDDAMFKGEHWQLTSYLEQTLNSTSSNLLCLVRHEVRFKSAGRASGYALDFLLPFPTIVDKRNKFPASLLPLML